MMTIIYNILKYQARKLEKETKEQKLKITYIASPRLSSDWGQVI